MTLSQMNRTSLSRKNVSYSSFTFHKEMWETRNSPSICFAFAIFSDFNLSSDFISNDRPSSSSDNKEKAKILLVDSIVYSFFYSQ